MLDQAPTPGNNPLVRAICLTSVAGGVTNRHLYDAPWHTLADLDVTGGVMRTYLYGPGVDELIAMTVHTGPAPATYYAIRDHQNTIWAWVDEGGEVVESYDYDAWGRLLIVCDASGHALTSEFPCGALFCPYGTHVRVPTSALGNRFLFQGREYSYATGLYHFRMRWYDPVTGRWLSSDPIGIAGGWNQYVFCGNDPVNGVDPLGLKDYAIQTVSGNVSVGPFAAEGGTIYAVDLDRGSVFQYTYGSGGVGLGAGAAVQGEVGVLSMDDPRDILGWGVGVSGFAAAGKGVSAQTSGTPLGGPIAGSAAAGGAAGVGVGISGSATYTWNMIEYSLHDLPPKLLRKNQRFFSRNAGSKTDDPCQSTPK